MVTTFRILRFDPEKDSKPHWEPYRVEMEPTDRVLDGLEAIKGTLDGSLSLRRSCAHGICGSDAMMINGRNRLACKVLVKNLKQPICVEPMRGFKVIKDLIVDMEPFFAKYRQVKPYLIEGEPAPEKERLQSPAQRERFDDTTKCILCGGCTTSCPSFWANPDYIGPASIVQAHRFLFDSRDAGKEERLEVMNRNDGVWRCRTVFNCVEACPRGINVTKAIAEIKRALIKGMALSLIGLLLPASWALPAEAVSGSDLLRGLGAEESPLVRRQLSAGLEEPSGESGAERWDRFKELLRRAAVGPDRGEARELLLKQFGEVSEGQGGVETVIPNLLKPRKEAIAIYLFTVPGGEQDSHRKINLTIPSRFRGQRLRLIPAAGPQGELMLKEYVRQPPILFREVRWRDSPPGWIRLLPTRQERLREVWALPPAAGMEPIEVEQDYDPDYLEEERGMPPDLVEDLEEGGYLYRNAAGWIPGELVALIARTVSEMNRESYPLTSLQDLLGAGIGQVESLVNYHRLPLVRESGKSRRLSRWDALRLVLMARIRQWIAKKAGGFLSFREASRRLQISYPRLEGWPRAASRPPYFDGAPLWVRIGKRHAITKRGFQGLLRDLDRRRPGPEEVSIWDAVKERYGKGSYLAWENRHRACFRAVLERGIPFRELNYPLKEIQPLFVVSRSHLEEIFREAEHPAALEPGQIRPERWYASAAVAQALGVKRKTARRHIRDKRIPSKRIFDSHWVSGAELLRFLEKARSGPSAGAEEISVPPAPYPPLIIRPMRPQDYGDDSGEGEVMAIERLHPKPQGNWEWKYFAWYAGMKQALIAKDRDRGRIAGFLVFASRLNRIEIRNLSVHPDYRASGAIERALVEWLQDFALTWPITLVAHEEDSVTLAMMERLGTTSRMLRDHFPAGKDGIKRDGIEFTLKDRPRTFVPLSVRDRRGEGELDAVVREARDKVASGALLISTAAIRVFEVLEEVAREEAAFSNWGDAYVVLFDANRVQGLGIARSLIAFMKEAARQARRGGDPREALARRLAQFQELAEGRLPSEFFRTRWAADPDSGLEEGPRESRESWNIKVRLMFGSDYGWGVEHAPVLEIQDAAPSPEPPWDAQRFHGYAQMERAVVAWDEGNQRVVGFLVFERREPDKEDVVQEPNQVEIIRWGVHPDYWESAGVEREMIRALREWFPGIPIIKNVHPRDRGSQQVLKHLGFASSVLPARTGDERMEFMLADLAAGDLEARNLDREVSELWDRASSGEIAVDAAAVEVSRILEEAAAGFQSFSRWREAYNVLTLADDEIGLGGAVAFRLFTRWAMKVAGDGQDPIPELSRHLTLFRDFVVRSPSEYLAELWRTRDPDAGLEELPKELVNRLREETGAAVTSPVLLPDRNGIPHLSRAHRLAVPSAPDEKTPPLLLVQEGLLPENVLGQFEKRQWAVQTVPLGELAEARLAGRVKNALAEWERPVLLVVGPEVEDAVRELPGYDSRLTAVVLSAGLARHKALLSYLTQTLQLPGRFFRLEYVVETSFDEWIAVSTQL